MPEGQIPTPALHKLRLVRAEGLRGRPLATESERSSESTKSGRYEPLFVAIRQIPTPAHPQFMQVRASQSQVAPIGFSRNLLLPTPLCNLALCVRASHHQRQNTEAIWSEADASEASVVPKIAERVQWLFDERRTLASSEVASCAYRFFPQLAPPDATASQTIHPFPGQLLRPPEGLRHRACPLPARRTVPCDERMPGGGT